MNGLTFFNIVNTLKSKQVNQRVPWMMVAKMWTFKMIPSFVDFCFSAFFNDRVLSEKKKKA